MAVSANRRWILTAALAVGLAALAAGCELTRQQYEAVSIGWTPGEVKKVMGEPRYRFEAQWIYTRQDPRDLTKVEIRFSEDGRVAGKAWLNPERPWENHREGDVP